MDYEKISPELREKAKGLAPDELVQLAKEEGIELGEAELERIAGGGAGDWYNDSYCPHCGVILQIVAEDEAECPSCGRRFGI